MLDKVATYEASSEPMKPKVWVLALNDRLDDHVDAFDYIFWRLAQQNPKTFVYIRDEMSLRDAMTLAAMQFASDGYEPFKN